MCIRDRAQKAREENETLRARLDGDDDVDSDDLARFLTCFAGANTLPLPACMP